jgi:hypothetical protein
MNIPSEKRRDSGCLIVVPEYVKELVDHQLSAKSEKAPNLTIGQWLEAQPEFVRRRERLRILRKYGLTRFPF